MREIYMSVEPNYTGRITVPVLFDKVKKTIVNNESSEILRMLNSEFNDFSSSPEKASLDFYPQDQREAIDEVNLWIYNGI